MDSQHFRCFFSTATGWGTLALRGNRLEVRLRQGELAVDTLQVTRGSLTVTLHPGLTIRAGQPESIELPGAKT
jgi:hypothetical protein